MDKATKIAQTAATQVAREWLSSNRTTKLKDLHAESRARFEAAAKDQLGLTADDIAWIDTEGVSIATVNGVMTAHYHQHVSPEKVPFFKVYRALENFADRA